MGPRTVLDGGKSRPTCIRSPDRPALSQSLYLLSYPAHNWRQVVQDKNEGQQLGGAEISCIVEQQNRQKVY